MTWGSVERQLPLLMTAVIASILAIALLMVNAALARSARDVATHQLEAVTNQLASLFENGLLTAGNRLRTAAADTAIVHALTAPAGERAPVARTDPADTSTASPAERRLGRLMTASDTGLAVELWTLDGRRVAHAGRDLRADVGLPAPASEAGGFPVPRTGLEGLSPSDSVEFGRLYVDRGEVRFWGVAPVMDGASRVGYLARQYRLSSSGQVEQMVRGLTDAEIGMYLRTPSGDVWSTISGADAVAPRRIDSTSAGLVVARPDVGELIAVEKRLDGAPMSVVLEMPLAEVLASTHVTLTRLAIMGVLLTLVGAIVSWRVSRRFTTPLASITRAAEAFADGDHGARVKPAGGDELVRLAGSFNRMVEDVGASRAELELQTAEAEAARREAERTRLQAEAANRAKSDFLRVMSHELRTPLNAIGGYTELMELELRGPITEEQRRDLGRIRASQQHLLGLISGVLDLSRIESGRVSYQLESMRVDRFLAGIEDLVGPQVSMKLVSLDYVPAAPDLAVLADAEKLRQIMLNLISNAMRHTPPDGRITLSAEPVGDGSKVAIRVRDTGSGIAEDALERIFEPFVQLDRTLTSLHEGLGLGLSISRDLARGMGGDLTVASRVGSGSTFTLTLPRTEVNAALPVRPVSGDYPKIGRRPVS